MDEHPAFGDDIPSGACVIEIRLRELKQLFNSMDPSPFHERDLDPEAEELIIANARRCSFRKRLALVLYIDQPAGSEDEARVIGDSVREHFVRESESARQELRRLLRRGWISLAIGLAFLSAAVAGSAAIARLNSPNPLSRVASEGLLIGGWVAMWRPLQTFLYDWWPVLGARKLHDRLGRMAVRIIYSAGRT